jgi:hypothetical protein
MEDEFFDYIEKVREQRGIEAKDLAHKIWPEISVGAAATRYSRYKGLDGAKRQGVKLADAEAMCSALGLNMASVIFELKEKKRLY